jgi:hypothetical protein
MLDGHRRAAAFTFARGRGLAADAEDEKGGCEGTTVVRPAHTDAQAHRVTLRSMGLHATHADDPDVSE